MALLQNRSILSKIVAGCQNLGIHEFLLTPIYVLGRILFTHVDPIGYDAITKRECRVILLL